MKTGLLKDSPSFSPVSFGLSVFSYECSVLKQNSTNKILKVTELMTELDCDHSRLPTLSTLLGSIEFESLLLALSLLCRIGRRPGGEHFVYKSQKMTIELWRKGGRGD